jgi:sulfhydrogenase subunit alpha
MEARVRTIELDHPARTEGPGGVRVELEGNHVLDVRFAVHEGTLLLERLLRGRSWIEVAPIVSRTCSICPAAHVLTSVLATEDAFGVQVGFTTTRLRDLLLRGEVIENHALHLFLLAAPDYLGEPSGLCLAAREPEAVKLGLRLKRLGNLIQETVGGRAIQPVNVSVGGFTRVPTMEALLGLRAQLDFVLAEWPAALAFLADLPPVPRIDAETGFVALQARLGYGYQGGRDIVLKRHGSRMHFPLDAYGELLAARTLPHGHARHGAYLGEPFMVGALARVAVNEDVLPGEGWIAARRLGLRIPSEDPLDNNKAQAVELAADLHVARRLVELLLDAGCRPDRPPPVRPRAGSGIAATEAPGGLLLHSYSYDEQGRIAGADVITPTALNTASLERHIRIACEHSAGLDDESLKARLEMLVRAYDPCACCAVHVVRR